jgi:hypothetical protein
MRYLLLGFLNVTAGTALLSAQAVPGTYRPKPAQCREAAKILVDRTNDDWRWQILASCGRAGGRDLARALQEARSETDPAYLERLYGAMAPIRDPDVFAAALAVMQDDGASAPARATAILIAVSQHNDRVGLPLNLSLPEALRSGHCRLVPYISHGSYRSSSPLPANYQMQLGKALLHLSAAPDTPDLVKVFVNCSRSVTQGAIADAVPLSAIRVTYVCGNRYRVDNRSTESVQLSYQLSGTKQKGGFAVHPRASRTFTARGEGDLSLYYRGKLVQTVQNRGESCSPVN